MFYQAAYNGMTRQLWPIAAGFLIFLNSSTTRAGLPPAAPRLQRIVGQNDAWFKTDEGRASVEHIISWQNPNGGWWKKYDPSIARPRQG